MTSSMYPKKGKVLYELITAQGVTHGIFSDAAFKDKIERVEFFTVLCQRLSSPLIAQELSVSKSQVIARSNTHTWWQVCPASTSVTPRS